MEASKPSTVVEASSRVRVSARSSLQFLSANGHHGAFLDGDRGLDTPPAPPPLPSPLSSLPILSSLHSFFGEKRRTKSEKKTLRQMSLRERSKVQLRYSGEKEPKVRKGGGSPRRVAIAVTVTVVVVVVIVVVVAVAIAIVDAVAVAVVTVLVVVADADAAMVEGCGCGLRKWMKKDRTSSA